MKIMRHQEFWRKLLEWHKNNARTYSWRQTNNSLHILIAEFLLQQTHVRKVESVYEDLISSYPTSDALAKSDIHDLLYKIKPIGLNYRAERIKKSAQIICEQHDGYVPHARSKLLELPGVGSYIADAVLCYAYKEPTVPIDTNVIRVFSRYFGLKSNKNRPRTDKALAKSIYQLFPFSDTRTPNLAILDFAAIICTAIKPECDLCPLTEECFEFNRD